VAGAVGIDESSAQSASAMRQTGGIKSSLNVIISCFSSYWTESMANLFKLARISHSHGSIVLSIFMIHD
jgi:hypothetical protein